MKTDYDAIAEDWNRLRTHLPAPDLALFELFRCYIPPQGRVLDLGCGHGIPIAAMMTERGFTLTGVDRSERLLSLARRAMPQQEWIQSELESFEPVGHYHGVIIWDSMFHLPRHEHLTLLGKVFEALEPEGVVILSSGGSDTDLPPFTDIMLGHEFFYDAFPVPVLLRHCREMGFRILRHELVNEPDGGRDKGRLGVVLQKSATR
ncbi:class I SAM-dependent methyltransferase [Vibrio fluvialis]|jgi:2-polyprenyl-3-methyl-5-hydroxy-6-metoxy-1,4-benzoquinol methylase|uniref:class I SAM-dependent methyltransferase n=1 Tax=Vibrio TaxID=662 RepID=UPI001C9BC80D|nr:MULTISPECIES: class I SAM-dependent methyltransferase [Vibrio]EKO3436438.1 class I SAM-dependent methyltransferase [Vibrio fluvialis]EKO3953311.1 class I SAM-dependent methyltransferase [Vibrio fluvialis]EKO4001099.1 class I SAM-dependent methyltransferase [Vibrio fluvialis]ELS8947587.1 class I SAM-dependent methyltransferase [Vibrio fluvialis]ELV8554560.1 class I SAM-dependent methyltransferase [Vibrio fluvialis]